MGSNEKRTSMAGNESKNWMLPEVGWLLRERIHNKRKRGERGWEWRKMNGKMQYKMAGKIQGLPGNC